MFGLFGTIIGLLLILMGGYMVVFFPLALENQPGKHGFASTSIVMGFIFLVIGIALVFL